MSPKTQKINQLKVTLIEYFNLTLTGSGDLEAKIQILDRILEIANNLSKYKLNREDILDSLILPLQNFKRVFGDFSLDGEVYERQHLESCELVNNSSEAIIELMF